VTPNSTTLSPGQTKQFAASVAGTGTYTTGVTWLVNDVAGGNATLGTIDSNGLYVTPYPAPSSVTVKATSTFDITKSGTVTVTLSAPAVAAGPALTVNVAAQTHPISPLIYGMNFYPGNQSDRNYSTNLANAKSARVAVDRWGGNGTTRYNYKLDVSQIGGDWYYEVLPNSNSNAPDTSDFNNQYAADQIAGAKTLGTVPVIGWTTKSRTKMCSYSVAKYGAQKDADKYWSDCGNGVKTDGTPVANDPTDTCMAIDESWAHDWVAYLKGKFGDAAHGGVAIYSLDNEPTWWDTNHKDVHPQPFTYDEVTSAGLKVAKAVKSADSTAEVSGPVIDFWPAYFYSMKDIRAGWTKNGQWNSNPADRLAHGNIPLLEYYLQQFKQAELTDHTRYLDYLDLHTYFVANNAGFQPAGTTDKQQATINSTRVFWDSTYTSTDYPDPDTYQPAAPAIIRRMKSWIANDYPGTKTAITEYNWGAQEHISGAVAQADILGIFGREGLDLGTLWGSPITNTTDTYGNPIAPQYPGLMAFKMFRNYDGAGGEFGNSGLTATSADQSKLSVYSALRTTDNVVTVVVINKTFGDLKTDLQLQSFTATGAAKLYQYSNADLMNIKQLADITVPAPPQGSANSTIANMTFPAMSITVIAVPK
jgi:hypothetical protein